MIQAACPHQVKVVAAGAAGAAGAGGFPGTTGGGMPGLSAMPGAGAGAGAAGGAAATGFAAAFFSGTANSTSARAPDTAPATSRVTHTNDTRFIDHLLQAAWDG